MYYYVYEPVRQSKDRRVQERIKKLIVSLGIMGEVVTPNPARTVDELIDIAITKGYTTLVAIGSDEFANKVVSSLLNHKTKDEEHKRVFGFVPLDFSQSQLAHKLGVSNHDEAIQALRFRRIKTMSLSVVVPNKFFLIPLTIGTTSPFDITLYMPDVSIQSRATNMTITPDITIQWHDDSFKGGAVKQFFQQFLSKPITEVTTSFFKTDMFELKTNPSLPVYLGQEVIAKTPIRVRTLPDYLHIIVNRDTIALVGKEKLNVETTD